MTRLFLYWLARKIGSGGQSVQRSPVLPSSGAGSGNAPIDAPGAPPAALYAESKSCTRGFTSDRSNPSPGEFDFAPAVNRVLDASGFAR